MRALLIRIKMLPIRVKMLRLSRPIPCCTIHPMLSTPAVHRPTTLTARSDQHTRQLVPTKLMPQALLLAPSGPPSPSGPPHYHPLLTAALLGRHWRLGDARAADEFILCGLLPRKREYDLAVNAPCQYLLTRRLSISIQGLRSVYQSPSIAASLVTHP